MDFINLTRVHSIIFHIKGGSHLNVCGREGIMHASEGSTDASVFNDVELCPVLVNFLFDWLSIQQKQIRV